MFAPTYDWTAPKSGYIEYPGTAGNAPGRRAAPKNDVDERARMEQELRDVTNPQLRQHLQGQLDNFGTRGTTTTTNSGPSGEGEAWLKDVLSGKNLPFNPQQQAAMLGQQAEMSAAAEGARNDELMAGAAASGASGRDPSLRGAKAANFASRQVANQRAAGDIAAQANSANFNAQAGAAGALNANAMTRQGWQHDAQQRALSQAGSYQMMQSQQQFPVQDNVLPFSARATPRAANSIWAGGTRVDQSKTRNPNVAN